ncbi:hypothetical protein BO82DRAFT_205066 [Aspergillus uvarum CBS 121591]|uniref:Uncharacterized protein n=1 Tax=Aspergillus uvarum CBS 121591 TaxID=1448315 RepID=A0A319BYF7_9EURO|nr:hypothetical protein BO82DRAFT_205066 [Aspergillus uvarum CBS 121591]PYH76480.1 hypothetical protein BO82DRAFT_205066 [Aspergillus uvarum CBS 121591]
MQHGPQYYLRTYSAVPAFCPGDITYDLVAVHGHNGNALKTWTHKQSGVMWLRDLLPQELPTVRIITYSYNVRFNNFTGHQDRRNISIKLLSELVDLKKTDKIGTTLLQSYS